MTAYPDIVLEQAGDGVLVVRLDRPKRRNAMSVALTESLIALLAAPEGRKAGAIVLAGAGKGFCAGSDLAGLASMDEAGKSAFETQCGELARAMVAHPRPILAAVTGFAIGGGLTLAAACDIVVSEPAAKWSLPEVPIGLFPAWGLEAVAVRVGQTAARRLAFGLETLSGEAAAAIGLVDDLSDDPLAHALDLARRLAALPAAQVAATKDYFAQARTGAAADAHANRLFVAATRSPEAAASFTKFGNR